MVASRSDALVLFGVTGDLAHKTIFPALYAMVKRRDLKVPVIGVAFPKWSLDQLHKRVTEGHLPHTAFDATENWTYEMIQYTGQIMVHFDQLCEQISTDSAKKGAHTLNGTGPSRRAVNSLVTRLIGFPVTTPRTRERWGAYLRATDR